MSELPSGTVTFLFTDIEGSTQLLKRLGARYGEVLAEQQRIIRGAAAERGGREIDTQGDSFFFVFARANAALGAAVVAQRALAEHEWPEGAPVRVRMGLHTGEPVVGEERYVGMGVHRAARIGAVGHGGQVLLSNATRELVEDELGSVSIRHLGSYRLKDIDRPERLFQLDIEGLQSEFPPLKAQKVAEPSRVSRRTLLAAALAGVLAAAVAIPIFAFGQGGSDGAPLEAALGNSVGFVDTDSNDLVADVPVGTTPTDIAVAEGAVWVTNTGDGTVDRIDLTTRTVRQTIQVGNGPTGIAFGDGSIWVANGGSGTVSRIDPASNTVTVTIPVGNGPSGVAVGKGAVWVVNRDSHTMSKIDPAAGKVVRTFPVGTEPLDVAVGAEGVWVTRSEGSAIRVDPASGNVVETVGVGRRPSGIAVGAGSVWVSNNLDGTVSRIDPDSSAVTATIEIGEGPSGVAVGMDSVWVASEQEGTIARIDSATNQVVESISVGGSPVGVAVAPGGVFVAVRPGGGVHRGGTLTVVSFERDLGSLDFAVAYTTLHGFSLTNDGLTGWRRVGGQEGTQLAPNLALSIPRPTNGGRTYTFRVRKGVRYSTGVPVRAEDFRRAFERVFALNPFDSEFYRGIPGAEACRKRPQACDLSRSIVTDNRTGTVTFRLSEPDPDFPAKLAFPIVAAVPASTPMRDFGRRPLPATGPYMIASYVPGRQLRFVRNPSFRVWSRAARPDGYPDEIVLKLDVPVPAQIAAVSKGEAELADLTLSGSSEIGRLRTRFGSRLHSDPGPFVVYTFLNSRVPPFDDFRVRRALNLAVDREAVVRTFGGPDRASSTCQVLPENYQGYEPYCPYERNLAEARRLVSASGTKGQEVVVWTRRSYEPFFAHVIGALRDLGYRARLRVVDDVDYYGELGTAGAARVQAGYVGWGAAIPSPAEFFQSLLSFLAGSARYSDKGIAREVDRALELQKTDLPAANEVWTRVDRMLVDRAYLVPLYNTRAVAFVSDRVGNYQLHPFFYYLVDQMWVR